MLLRGQSKGLAEPIGIVSTELRRAVGDGRGVGIGLVTFSFFGKGYRTARRIARASTGK
jgi:hypothetical protein